MRRNTDGILPNIEDHILGLEEDIAIDLDPSTIIGLQRTSASSSSAVDSLEIELGTRDNGLVAVANGKRKIRQGGGAGKDDERALLVEFGALDLAVVAVDDVLVGEK